MAWKVCGRCGGTGEIPADNPPRPGHNQTCPTCHGDGGWDETDPALPIVQPNEPKPEDDWLN